MILNITLPAENNIDNAGNLQKRKSFFQGELFELELDSRYSILTKYLNQSGSVKF